MRGLSVGTGGGHVVVLVLTGQLIGNDPPDSPLSD